MVRARSFLFGSAARGDADVASDTDILIIYEREPSPLERRQTKALVVNQLKRDCAFAEYSWERLAAMFADGHLFTWHLYYEARALQVFGIGDQDFSFPKPSQYRSSRQDALNFLELLNSCARAVEGKTSSLVYEAGLAYLAIRNVGMSLSAQALSRPEFDRYVPFKVARALRIAPPCKLDIYDALVAARHSSQRGLDAPDLDENKLLLALMDACEWVKKALEQVNEISVA